MAKSVNSFVTTRLYKEPFTFTWKIEDYLDLTNREILRHEVNIEDTMYRINVTKWCLRNGMKVLLNAPEKHQSLKYNFAIVDENGTRKRQTQGRLDGTAKEAVIFSLLPQFNVKIEQYLSNGCLIIYGSLKHTKLSNEVVTVQNTEKHVPFSRLEEFSQDFGALLKSAKDSDVTIHIGECQIPAHVLILSARSPVFAAMFAHDMQEKLNKCIDVTDLSATAMRYLVLYIYTGKVEGIDDLSIDTVCDLYAAADKYAVLGLKNMCSEIMINKLSLNTLCSVGSIACRHSDENLQSRITQFISENDSIIENNSVWQDFVIEVPNLATQALSTILKKYKVSKTVIESG